MHEWIAMTVMLCVVCLCLAVLLLWLFVLMDEMDSDSRLHPDRSRRASRTDTDPAILAGGAVACGGGHGAGSGDASCSGGGHSC
jgi:hypothetical protein